MTTTGKCFGEKYCRECRNYRTPTSATEDGGSCPFMGKIRDHENFAHICRFFEVK